MMSKERSSNPSMVDPKADAPVEREEDAPEDDE